MRKGSEYRSVIEHLPWYVLRPSLISCTAKEKKTETRYKEEIQFYQAIYYSVKNHVAQWQSACLAYYRSWVQSPHCDTPFLIDF
jgi:hypothetical protein